MSETQQGRGRGRPRGRQASARAAILEAASAEFAERGYDATSLRAVARRAGVDSALVHHYFDGKPDLLAATLDVPVRPDRALDAILAGPPDEVGASIVRFITAQLAEPERSERVVILLRTAVGGGPLSRLIRAFITRELIGRLARAASGPDAELRASLAASQILGLLVGRYVLRVEPLASASPEELVERVGPVIQRHLFGEA